MKFRLSKQTNYLFILLFILGFLVHSFTLKLGVNLKFFQVAVLFALVMPFLKQKYHYKLSIFDKIIFGFAVFFIFWSVFSNLYSVHGEKSLIYTAYLTLTILFSLFFLRCTPLFLKSFNFYLKTYNLVLFLAIAFYFYIVFFIDVNIIRGFMADMSSRKDLVNNIYSFVFPEYSGMIMRFNGYNLDPNYWGLYALVSFWLLLLFSAMADRKGFLYSRRLYKLAIFLSLLSIILTFSRGVYLSYFISVTIYVFFSLRFKYIIYYVVGVFFLIFAFYLFYLNNELVKNVVDIKLSSDAVDNPRLLKWSYYVSFFIEGGFFRVFFGFGLIDLFVWYEGSTMHNTYLQILLSLGAVAFFAFLSLIFLSVFCILKFFSYRVSCIQLALLGGVLWNVLFIDMLYSIPLWVGIMLPLYSVGVLRKEG